jgi:hypothetical protein
MATRHCAAQVNGPVACGDRCRQRGVEWFHTTKLSQPDGTPFHSCVGEWRRLPVEAARLEALMANKDKGGRSVKKAAAKNLKEKRAEKKAKKGEHRAV